MSGCDSPTGVPGAEDLHELALDMRWSWDHGADELWKQIEPELWELRRSPWVILQTAAATKIEELCRNPTCTIRYLLDSNDPANPPVVRGITSELYGGGPALRLQQEMVLGIGGWRLLRTLGLHPEVCHLSP